VPNSSGDGSGYSTIQINPDTTTNDNRYIILDPTTGFEGPDHIHIRPGGTMDESTVNLILGGEKNAVIVSDDERAVAITTRAPRVSQALINLQTVDSAEFVAAIPDPEGVLVQTDWKVLNAGTEYTVTGVSLNTPEEGLVTITATGLTFGQGSEYTFYYDEPFINTWAFTPEGYLYGPAMGGLFVSGLLNGENDLWLGSNDSVVLNGGESGGEFLNDSSVPSNQIATIGDVDAATDKAYISLYSTADQGPFTANTIQPFTYTNVDFSNDISLVEGSLITFAKAGKYNLAFSAQLHQTNSSGIVNIWLRKNGNNMSATNTKFSITANNPYYVAAWNFFIDAAAGDDLELIWSSNSNHTVIEYEAATGSGATEHPSIPSIILTVNEID
jgi:hypothetical protein